MNPSVAIDFDGVLCLEKWPDIGAVDFDMVQAAKEAQDAGVMLILNTCREGKFLAAALDRMRDYELGFDAVNENLPERIELYGGDCRKISADYYIDDHAVGYNRLIAIGLLERLARECQQ